MPLSAITKLSGAPEEALLTDRPLQGTLVLWVLSVLLVFYIY